MIQALLANKVWIGLVLTFVLGGLGALTGVVSPEVATVITLVISGLTTVGHTYNLIKGVRQG